MIEIKGICNTAKCYCQTLDERAEEQIQNMCDEEIFSETTLRIMPDVHAGKGCTIGTTMTLTDKVVPAMVGVDIGCGMETVKLREKTIDFYQLDTLVRKNIPCGREIRSVPHRLNEEIDLTELRCFDYINAHRAQRSIGTLGGGNHFIEAAQGKDGQLYLIVHSGSRHLGNEVAQYYQEEGWHALKGDAAYQIKEMIARFKAGGREKEISKELNMMKAGSEAACPVSKEFAYVEGKLFEDYIHDMKIVQHFAALNRKAMVQTILDEMNLEEETRFTTIHNYIDTEKMILRKGAVSAEKDELLLIPINMRDGSLLCKGKGNGDWNFSAPHGAGRLMSRKKAQYELSMEEYRTSMEGIFSTCIGKDTLDESPMAYKDIHEIISQIEPTAEIIDRLKPLYNFKAGE